MTLNDLLNEESLRNRFEKKITKCQAVGLDGTSVDSFSERLDDEIDLIQRKIANLTYRFTPFKEKLILKGKHSNPRVVHIPTVRDRLVLSVLNNYLNDVFKGELSPHQDSVQNNVSAIKTAIDSEVYDAFLKLDVKQFFPSLNHEILLAKLKEKISDPQVISLLKKVLNRSKEGIAQGLSIASVLAAIYLNEIDNDFKNRLNIRYFRFVDDILILCKASDAKQIESDIQKKMLDLKLELHALNVGGKSEIGELKRDSLEYLGFVFHGEKVSVRKASVERLRNRLIQLANRFKNEYPSYKKEDLNEFYRQLNLKITGCLYKDRTYGWLFFFHQINDLTLLHHLDWFVIKILKQTEIPYKKSKVKSFVKSYFEISSLKPERLDANSYVPSFFSKHDGLVPEFYDVEEEPFQESKKEVDLSRLEQVLDLDNFNDQSTQDMSDLEAMIMELEDDVVVY